MPWDAGLSSVLYRTDLVDPADVADPSWGLLFNEKYKGKVVDVRHGHDVHRVAARVRGCTRLSASER